MSMPPSVLSFIASLGGSVGITFALIKVFGNKILENQFEKSLESYKYKINSRFDRISKIHEKEFEILPIIWKDIIQTNTAFYLLTSQLQSYPNINRMNDIERQELYDYKELKKSEIEKIEGAYDKLKEYIEIDYWGKYNTISKELNQFSTDYICNRIFITKVLEEKLEIIKSGFFDMIITLKNSNHNNEIDYEFKMSANRKQDEIFPVIDEVGKIIQDRLCFSEAYEK